MGFDQSVWDVCRKIPKGKVMTYKQIADILGSKAYRAVGQALNRNPYWLEVPCHRVVGSDGSLTGFASGIRKKQALLEREGISIRDGRIDMEKHLLRI
jgi:methylated-DNA-[protein]-cysteine S-methyltransferase